MLSFLPKFLPVVSNCAAAVASSTTVDCGRQLTGWLARNLPSSISSLIEIDRLYTAETSRPRCQTHDASHGRARTWQEMGKAEWGLPHLAADWASRHQPSWSALGLHAGFPIIVFPLARILLPSWPGIAQRGSTLSTVKRRWHHQWTPTNSCSLSCPVLHLHVALSRNLALITDQQAVRNFTFWVPCRKDHMGPAPPRRRLL